MYVAMGQPLMRTLQAQHSQSNLRAHGLPADAMGDATGGRSSPAARAVAWLLVHRPLLAAGHLVIELGCGLGVAGIAAGTLRRTWLAKCSTAEHDICVFGAGSAQVVCVFISFSLLQKQIDA